MIWLLHESIVHHYEGSMRTAAQQDTQHVSTIAIADFAMSQEICTAEIPDRGALRNLRCALVLNQASAAIHAGRSSCSLCPIAASSPSYILTLCYSALCCWHHLGIYKGAQSAWLGSCYAKQHNVHKVIPDKSASCQCSVPDEAPEAINALMNSCMAPHAQERPDMKQVVRILEQVSKVSEVLSGSAVFATEAGSPG